MKTIQWAGYTIHLRHLWVVQIEGLDRWDVPLLMGDTQEQALEGAKGFIKVIEKQMKRPTA